MPSPAAIRRVLAPSPRASELSGLTVAWTLDESSGNRVDAVGGKVLTDHNGTTAGAGVSGQAASFASASSQWLQAPDHADLKNNAAGFSWTDWVFLTDTANHEILNKGSGGTASTLAFRLFCQSGGILVLRVSDGTSVKAVQQVISGAALHHLHAYYDPVAQTIGLGVDGVVMTTAFPGTPKVETGPLYVGSNQGAAPFMDGKIDELYRWGARPLSDVEYGRAAAGYCYPFTGRSPGYYNPVTYLPGVTYSSSIDSITNLFLNAAYPRLRDRLLPVVLWMHGYGGDANFVATPTLAGSSFANPMARLAQRGLCVIAPGMRGRNSASGSQDSSRREIFDIWDAWQWAIANLAGIIDPNLLAIVGYSGGGGNAYVFGTRFPDFCALVVSHFGMSRYGSANGWAGGWTGSNTTWMGGSQPSVPDNYASNDALTGFPANYLGGAVRIFHQTGDTVVPVAQSQQMQAALVAAGHPNLVANYTTDGVDPFPWDHGNPVIGDAGYNNRLTENLWAADLAAGRFRTWQLPAAGSLKVRGWILTRRFEIRLGTLDGTGSTWGLSQAADLIYDADAGSYVVTPTTSAAMDVWVKDAQGRSGSAAAVGGGGATITVS